MNDVQRVIIGLGNFLLVIKLLFIIDRPSRLIDWPIELYTVGLFFALFVALVLMFHGLKRGEK